jgi:hypothetical protein
VEKKKEESAVEIWSVRSERWAEAVARADSEARGLDVSTLLSPFPFNH